MQKLLAQIFSVALHPLLMPTYGLFLIFNSGSYLSYINMNTQYLYLIIFASTFLFPLLFIPFFKAFNIIKSIEMETPQERIIPLSITLLIYYLTYSVLNKSALPQIFILFMLVSTTAVALTLLVSIKFKISAHMIGIGGLAGAAIAISFKLNTDLQLYIIALIFLSGLLGFARLKLNSHNPLQIYSGFILGTALSSAIIYLY